MECFKSQQARNILKGENCIYWGFLYITPQEKKVDKKMKEVWKFTLFNENNVKNYLDLYFLD